MAGLPKSPLDLDEIMREWFMALEYVARTIGQTNDESDQVPADAARVRDEVLEVELRAAPMAQRASAQWEPRRRKASSRLRLD